MRKTLGILFLLLAILGGIGDIKILIKGDTTSSSTGNSAYNSGRKVGRMVAMVSPLIFGALAWWLLAGESAPRAVRPSPAGGSVNRKTVILVASIAGGLVALVVLGFIGLVIVGRFARSRRNAPVISEPSQRPPASPQTSSGNAPMRSAPTETGAFKLGANVEANWAGRWIPGKITSINHGGFSLFVQLEDARFRHPIVLSTNQVRLKQ